MAVAAGFGQNDCIVPPEPPPVISTPRRTRRASALLRATTVLGLVALLVLPLWLSTNGSDPVNGHNAMGRSATELGGDLVRAEQWHLTMLGAERAWKDSTGAGVVVAVIDSGVAATHPDLRGQVLSGIDYVDSSGNGAADAAGHGTSVAALIAGSNDDDEGVVGLAPDAKILPVRVLDAKNEYLNPELVAEAVVWAVDHGARVINLSLGSQRRDDMLADAIDYAFARDVVVVACVGNVAPGGAQVVWHPAREPGVVAVGAVASDGKHWKESLVGNEVVLTAPGSNLLAARPKGYTHMSGTSFAAPLVSATAALIRSKYPQMSAASVVQRLISTARDEGTKGRDSRYGFGVVDPVAALTGGVAEVVSNPLDTTPPPGKAAFGPAGAPLQPALPSEPANVRMPKRFAERQHAVSSSASSSAPRTTANSAPEQPTAAAEAAEARSPWTPGGSLGLVSALGVFALLVTGILAFLRRI